MLKKKKKDADVIDPKAETPPHTPTPTKKEKNEKGKKRMKQAKG